MSRYLLAIAILTVALASPIAAEDSRVFACNYTVSLKVDGESFVVTLQTRVRDGSHIPIDAQDVRLRMRVSTASTEKALIELILLERTNSGWAEIYPEPPSFETTLGEPVEFNYSDDIAEIDVALIVSEAAS